MDITTCFSSCAKGYPNCGKNRKKSSGKRTYKYSKGVSNKR